MSIVLRKLEINIEKSISYPFLFKKKNELQLISSFNQK